MVYLKKKKNKWKLTFCGRNTIFCLRENYISKQIGFVLFFSSFLKKLSSIFRVIIIDIFLFGRDGKHQKNNNEHLLIINVPKICRVRYC